jgi:hypothetical protein
LSLADSFRERATEQRNLANGIVDRPLVKVVVNEDGTQEFDAKNLLVAIVGHLNATILETAADQMDYLRVSTGDDSLAARRRKIMEQNDAIRRAAASGNWVEFDRLAAGADPASPG